MTRKSVAPGTVPTVNRGRNEAKRKQRMYLKVQRKANVDAEALRGEKSRKVKLLRYIRDCFNS